MITSLLFLRAESWKLCEDFELKICGNITATMPAGREKGNEL